MKVAVVGCGYVGLISGVGLASVGHEVVGIEADAGRRDRISAGAPPFHEPGLRELMSSELERGSFRVSSDIALTAEADVVLLAVQTPADSAGGIDLRYLTEAANAVSGAFAADPTRLRTVAVRSTIVPGTVDNVLAPIFGAAVAVASNPEFLREGSAVQDFLSPDRVVIGCREPWGGEVVAELYAPLRAALFLTSPATAELAKYTSNAFLATLVSFSNEIARICESLSGVDVEDVLGILHADRRLNAKSGRMEERPEIVSYLKAGCGYGGSCLPKDLSALIAAGESYGDELPLLRSVRAVNEGQAARVVASARDALGGLAGATVAVLGVAFKAGTDDLRASPGLRIVDECLEQGASVTIYDPLVSRQALDAHLEPGAAEMADTLESALAGANACIITTNAPEIAALGELLAGGGSPGLVVVDGRRVLDADRLNDETQIAVGRARVTPSRNATV